MKKVTFIIPLYNNEKYIKKCIMSILSQSYKEIEVIVIDDGSTDNSYKVCQEILDPRIKLFKQYNFGAPLARNNGIKYSTGEYIMFLDSDDYLCSNKVISEIYKETNGFDFDLYIGGVQEVDIYGKYIRKKNIVKNFILDDFEQNLLCDPVPAGKIFRKSIIEKNNLYFDNVRIGQDLNFYLKYVSRVTNIVKSNKNIASYRILENSISRTYGLKIFDIVDSLNKVEKYYLCNSASEKYVKMLKAIRYIHFYNQFVKYVFVKDKSIRNIVKHYFTKEIAKINLDYNCFSIQTVNYLKKIKLKFYLKQNYLYYLRMKYKLN